MHIIFSLAYAPNDAKFISSQISPSSNLIFNPSLDFLTGKTLHTVFLGVLAYTPAFTEKWDAEFNMRSDLGFAFPFLSFSDLSILALTLLNVTCFNDLLLTHDGDISK